MELGHDRFSLISTPDEEYSRCINAFPLGADGYRLGRPFDAGVSFVHAALLPPLPSKESASDGGGARDKARSHPPLKLRWRPPGSTVAPNTPSLPESLKKKQSKRLSVHFEATTPTKSSGKRAKDNDEQQAVSPAAADTPVAAKKAKHKESGGTSPDESSKKSKKEKKEKKKTPPESPSADIVSPSKKSKNKEK